MEKINLLKRITRAVEDSLNSVSNEDDGRFNAKKFSQLVLVVGNGMTRIAAGLQGLDFEWRRWAESTLSAVALADEEIDLPYMEALGYNYPEIFEYATARASKDKSVLKTAWQILWDFVVKLEPSQFHLGLLNAADCVITTNYDDLLEFSAKKFKLDVRVRALRADIYEFAMIPGFNDSERSIFKIHGTLPPRPEDPGKNQQTFDDWFSGKPLVGATGEKPGPDQTITNSDLYEKYALLRSEKQFLDTFGEVYSKLVEPKTLVVLCGVGLRAEELILTRLLTYCLQQAEDKRPTLAVVVAEPRLDPLYKYTRFGIKPIRIPLGLVSSPGSRAVAHLAVLKNLLNRVETGRVTKDSLALEGLLRGDALRGVCDISSRVIAVGQSALNRVHGIETAVAQEQAYAPRHPLSWAPADPDHSTAQDGKPQWLSNVEVGGQVLIPALVFDALGIPCSVASQVYTDEVGRAVISRLGRTKQLDYEWMTLNQRVAAIPDLHNSAPTTDNSTVVTWMGLRTIIDSRSRVATDLKFKTGNASQETSFFRLGASVLYTSKDLWVSLKPETENLGDTEKPLIVYDSGGAGDYSAEEWVAKNEGVIIASALATQAWFAAEGKADRKKAKDLWREGFESKQPKDDRGRIYQIQQFLETLEGMRDKLPWFLKSLTELAHARAFITTLGDLGMVYWIRAHSNWQGPFWSGIAGEIEDSEVRCGLACGDVARAGFAASILPYAERSDLTVGSFHHAVSWANWFGAQKIKFFSIEDFVKFLDDHKIGDVLLKSPNASIPFGVNRELGCALTTCWCHAQIASSDALASIGNLSKTLAEWFKNSKDFFVASETETKTRVNWVNRVDKWKAKRYPNLKQV